MFNTAMFDWLACTELGKWAVLYLSVMGYDFASLYDFSIGLRNCSNSVVFYSLFHYCFFEICNNSVILFLLCASIKLVIFVQWQICRTMKWKILIFLHCRSLFRIVIRPLHLDYVKRGMILNTQQQMVKGLHIMGVESLSYTDTKDIHTGWGKAVKSA